MLFDMLNGIPYWGGSILTIVALVHFFRTRPEGYWFFVIFFLPGIGPLVYLFIHVLLPMFDSGIGGTIEGKVASTFAVRKRINELELLVEENSLPAHCAELGELLYRQGNYPRAEQMLKRAVPKMDHDPEAQFWLSLTLEKQGKYAEAAALLNPIVQKNSRYKFGEAALAFARTLAAAGRRDEAKTVFAQIVGQSTLPEARVRYGLLLGETGELTAAREHLETAIREARGLPRHNSRAARPYIRQAKQWLSAHRS